MPGKGGAQIVCSECAQNDRVQRGARLGTVVRVQTVSDGPNGVCSATEVTVRWDDGEKVALNPMAPRGQPESPSGVVWQQAPDEIAQELIRLAAEEAAVDQELLVEPTSEVKLRIVSDLDPREALDQLGIGNGFAHLASGVMMECV